MKQITPCSKKCYQAQGNQKTIIKQPNDDSVGSWTNFFKRFRFFGKRYSHFIRIDIVANSLGDESSVLEWFGFVESKLFILLNLLAKQPEISEIRAYPNSFKNKQHHELGLMDQDIGKYQYVDTYFFGFKLMKNTQGQLIDLQEHIVSFCQKLDFGRIQKTSTDIRILHFRREELPN